MGVFGTKATALKVDNKKVIVNLPKITFLPNNKENIFRNLNIKKEEKMKEKIKIISLCLSGNMLPEWIKNNGNISQEKNSQKEVNIKEGDRILQEVLKEFLDLNIGCQGKGYKTKESWFDRIVEKRDLGGVISISIKNKKYLDELKNMKEQVNYWRECKGKSIAGMFCKLEGSFKHLWKDDVKKIIEERIWKVLKEFMIGWINLKNPTWRSEGNINIVEWEISNYKNKKKIQIEYGGGYTNFEIGEWWFKTGLWQQGKEGILKKLDEDKGSNKNDWVNRIKFMIGRNKANIEDFFKNWLWNELEKEFSEELKYDCGMWNGGVSCPEGGLIY
ncbi:hypothetical protein [Mycoplasma parvum]|uniref:Uncharacterized protein n=1 Tax=Mycoplasma parvum str. Indiana TaxID=1403316 RepID=U5NFL8_9MOLU|nr:hypothetical protein [Mycoplasma parvum]AGX88949.1 hypothetical protein PRV_00920 [Mycoplasma parvum str. Indiana]